MKRNRILTNIAEEGDEEARGTMIGQKRPPIQVNKEIPGLDVIGEKDDSDGPEEPAISPPV